MTPPPITTHTLPAFITFTGIDDHTDLAEASRLAADYPIEYGMLFSPDRQGSGRYPSLQLADRLREVQRAHVGVLPMRFSAHLCGQHARDVRHKGYTVLDDVIQRVFARAQINLVVDDNLWTWEKRLDYWAANVSAQTILQCRDEFPVSKALTQWLYDPSGGRGIPSIRWPRPKDPDRLAGFAGGIGPATVKKAVEQIGWMSRNYWLDLETAVRDVNDRFDLGVCRRICELVYGKAVGAATAPPDVIGRWHATQQRDPVNSEPTPITES